jgi:hypothetical protein
MNGPRNREEVRFRLIYYAYWHILWGTIRIPILF